MKAVDGGLACKAYKDLHAKKDCSNPGISSMVNWSISIKKCMNVTQERL